MRQNIQDIMGVNGQGRYLRTAHPQFPKPPLLGELKDSPWKQKPLESSQLSIDQHKTNAAAKDPNGRMSSIARDEKYVDMDESDDLGELNKYALDDEMYHPDIYDDTDDLVNQQEHKIECFL